MENNLLNTKDMKILASIIEDARIPLSELSNKVKFPREVIAYRLKNLEKTLIAGYQARINLDFFSSSTYTLFLNLPSIDRDEVIARLKSLPNVNWIGSTLGRWNYIITFSITKEHSLNSFLDKLSHIFSKIQISQSLNQHIQEYKDSFSGLFGQNKIISSREKATKIDLDETDKKIIQLLTKNCRYSNQEIADKLDITRETVRQRIKNLEKQKIILGYRTMILPQALDLTSYVLAIKCNSSNSEINSRIGMFLAKELSVSYINSLAGEFNLLSVLTSKSLKELDLICEKLRKEFPDIIKEIDLFPLVKVGSQEYLPS